ncbi:MAG: hypothetical protein ACJAX3_001595 [Patiriisocius sp.]|jgi:hypothetical protein
MKTLFKFSLTTATLFILTPFTSCQEDDVVDAITNAFEFNAEDNNRAAQADGTIEGAFNIMENGYVEGEEGRNQTTSLFPDCVTITIQPNGEGGVITLDFGEGCTLNNGANVTGIMTIEYGAFVAGTRTINYSYNNFTYNQNTVTGGGEVFRQIANENENPQSTVNETITVGYPNTDVTATRTGTRVVEWTAGVGSGTWVDNIYFITGNWDTQFTNGFFRNGLVTQTLIRELDCPYIVSGRLEVSQNSFDGTIDWGDDSCDNQATFEIGGEVYDIVL